MPDLLVEVANLPILGERRSTYLVDDPNGWSLNHIHWHLSGYDVDLYQLPEFIRARRVPLLNQQIHTTDVFVRDVRASDYHSAFRLVTDLCNLLSLATLSQVTPTSTEFQQTTRVFRSHRVMTEFRPPIDIRTGSEIRKFVEGCWTTYRKRKLSRRLAEVTDYLAIAERRDQVLEPKVLLSFVVLENLKATYARSQKIPFRDGFFRKPNNKKYSFRELLNLMFASVGMGSTPQRLISLRNEIVHYGLSKRSPERLAFLYSVTMALITEYLLRFLGYKGAYHNYRANARRIIR